MGTHSSSLMQDYKNKNKTSTNIQSVINKNDLEFMKEFELEKEKEQTSPSSMKDLDKKVTCENPKFMSP